jgi:hypothetical protein
MKRLRVYVDASVVGGCCDEEFSVDSQRFFELAVEGSYVLLISDILADELRLAPDEVKDVLQRLGRDCVAHVEASDESRRLRDLYLAERVVGRTHLVDAHHNAVNLREGYAAIAIHSPKEVI